MNKYEIMYILDKDLTDENRAKLIDRFTQVVEDMGGKIVNLDKWGIKRFAYEINHKREGFYFLMYIEADPQVPQEIERLVGITEGVVRCMIIKRDEFNFKKSRRVKVEEVKNVEDEKKANSDNAEPNKSEEKAKTEPVVDTKADDADAKADDADTKADVVDTKADDADAKADDADAKADDADAKADDADTKADDADKTEYGAPVVDGVSAEFGEVTDNIENTADNNKE